MKDRREIALTGLSIISTLALMALAVTSTVWVTWLLFSSS